MTERRSFIKGLAGILPASLFFALPEHGLPQAASEKAGERDYYEQLGVKTIINAGLPYSRLSGSWMWPEAIEAMNYAVTRLVRMSDLMDAVGKRLGALIGCQSAMITAGASSAITLGTAACITGTDEDKIRRLPDTKGIKNEVLILKEHRYEYEQSVRCAGGKLVEVTTAADIQKAVSGKTAMMLYYYGREPEGRVDATEFIALGKKHGVPVLMDGATTAPPYDTLSELMAMGCDLAAFSGGKGLRGPYGAGLLLGRKDLIEAARLNGPPNDRTIGRGMKVGREEILGMMAAVETALKQDYQAELRTGKRWLRQIADRLSELPGLRSEIWIPDFADRMPRMRLSWDESKVRITVVELIDRLRAGDPSIEVVSLGHSEGTFQISSWIMRPGEADVVGRRIQEELRKACAVI